MNSNKFWKLFKDTGRIEYYLKYRTAKNKEKNN